MLAIINLLLCVREFDKKSMRVSSLQASRDLSTTLINTAIPWLYFHHKIVEGFAMDNSGKDGTALYFISKPKHLTILTD
jgi:hypothetical protein